MGFFATFLLRPYARDTRAPQSPPFRRWRFLSNSAKADFFDFLFGPRPAVVSPMPIYPGRMSPRWRAEPRFHKREHHRVAHHHPVFVDKSGIEKGRHSNSPRAVTGLMDDDSLQDGDAVMTQSGIRIFIGSGDHHRLEDFVSPSEIKGLSRRRRSSLAAIEAHPGRQRSRQSPARRHRAVGGGARPRHHSGRDDHRPQRPQNSLRRALSGWMRNRIQSGCKPVA